MGTDVEPSDGLICAKLRTAAARVAKTNPMEEKPKTFASSRLLMSDISIPPNRESSKIIHLVIRPRHEGNHIKIHDIVFSCRHHVHFCLYDLPAELELVNRPLAPHPVDFRARTEVERLAGTNRRT